MPDVRLHSTVMDRLRRIACRAIDAAAMPVGMLAQRLIVWSAAQQHTDRTVTPPTWAEAAADARRDRWAGPFDYTQSADHDAGVCHMRRDGFGRR